MGEGLRPGRGEKMISRRREDRVRQAPKARPEFMTAGLEKTPAG